jgi:hypothetical protein
MSQRLLRIAVAYWVIAVCWGIYMGASGDHTDMPVHAHLNLLGWVSLALCGVIYAVAPHLAGTALARAHFWLHNLGLPPLMAGVWLIYHGRPEIGGPITGIASIAVGLGILSFAANVWLRGFPFAAGQSDTGSDSAAAASMRSMSASLKP